jgi:hypothetical protein
MHRSTSFVAVLAPLLAVAVGACGGSAGDATPPAANPPAGNPAANPPSAPPAGGAVVPADGPPGTNGFSDVTGSSALQVGAGSGLTFVDHPAAGEPSIQGLVLVNAAGVKKTPTPPPADTVVTINGVPLVRAVVNGATSDRFFTVDPAGPQPTIAADGYLHVTASSASLGGASGPVSRTLNLACPFDVALTVSPAPGASLGGASSLGLAWSDALPHQPPGTVLPSGGPAATLYAYDAATHALGAPLLTVPFDQAAHAVSVPVRPTQGGYLAELRWPAVAFLDAVTGGFCSRTKRVVYAP